jgi:hypothetical protein
VCSGWVMSWVSNFGLRRVDRKSFTMGRSYRGCLEKKPMDHQSNGGHVDGFRSTFFPSLMSAVGSLVSRDSFDRVLVRALSRLS